MKFAIVIIVLFVAALFVADYVGDQLAMAVERVAANVH